MDELVRAGKVRYIGHSNFSAAQVAEADELAAARGLTRCVSAQNEYSWLARDAERDLIPECERLGLGLLPYFPLARGLLTGKYRRGEPAPEGTRLAEQGLERRRRDVGSGRGARGVRARPRPPAARRRDRRPRRPAGRRLGDRRRDHARAGARERGGRRVGALAGRARRAARAVASRRGARRLRALAADGGALGPPAQPAPGLDARDLRVARRPARPAARADDPRAGRGHGRDGLPRRGAPGRDGPSHLERPLAEHGRRRAPRRRRARARRTSSTACSTRSDSSSTDASRRRRPLAVRLRPQGRPAAGAPRDSPRPAARRPLRVLGLGRARAQPVDDGARRGHGRPRPHGAAHARPRRPVRRPQRRAHRDACSPTRASPRARSRSCRCATASPTPTSCGRSRASCAARSRSRSSASPSADRDGRARRARGPGRAHRRRRLRPRRREPQRRCGVIRRDGCVPCTAPAPWPSALMIGRC